MSNPVISVQKPIELVVANMSQGSYPTLGVNIRDVVIREVFTVQHVSNIGAGVADPQEYRGLSHQQFPDAVEFLVEHEAEVTVDDNDFSAGAVIRIGEFELIANIDFVEGASSTDTASAIAAAISNLPGYSATNVGPIVTVVGKKGAQGKADRFEVQGFGAVNNFSDVSVFNGGSPEIGAPEITT